MSSNSRDGDSVIYMMNLQHPSFSQQHLQQQLEKKPVPPHRQPPFMSSDTDQWLTEDSQGGMSSKNSARRAKRVIPDTEKDDKYWEKRKRNNMAAKKSRENKRLVENDIRQKVMYLEEQNALLRKEIMIIKTRYGIPPDQSLLTPGERAQCMLEVKAAQEASEARRRKESSGSADDVSSTSPSVYPIGLNTSMENSEGDRRISTEASSSSPKMKDASYVIESPYGPAAYGPFNPSPSWAPATSGFQSYPGVGSSQVFTAPVNNQAKPAPNSNSFQENKHASAYQRYMHGAMAGYSTPYDLYMQPGRMVYDESHVGTPADLSINRKRQEEQRQAPRTPASEKSTGPATSSFPAPNRSMASGFLEDVSGMSYSLGQMHRGHEHYGREFSAHPQVNAVSMPGQNGQGRGSSMNQPNQEDVMNDVIIKRESEAHKNAVRRLAAHVDQIRDNIYTHDTNSS